MNIHEYQAKKLLSDNGVCVLRGHVVTTADEAVRVAQILEGDRWVLKAQIHAGGRGKGGGIKIAHSLDEVRVLATQMLGMQLITAQTGPQGQRVQKIYIEEAIHIRQEFYFSLLVDRACKRNVALISPAGGIDIEQTALQFPNAINKVFVDPLLGFQDYQARELASVLGLTAQESALAVRFFKSVYKTFIQYDASLLEINPLVLTTQGQIIALDAKMSFDENALFRQPDIARLQDQAETDPLELEAQRHALSYVKLEGNIGCMVNGAGLAMATMDIIQLYGGVPANFLDVGGDATPERVAAAVQLILSDPKVECVLVNIFGGIMRCDIVAQGILKAMAAKAMPLPFIVRLEGTNSELGKELLIRAELKVCFANSLTEAARMSVQSVQGAVACLS